MTRAEKVKREFDEAIRNREARVAILVHEGLRNALDLLDEQPANIIEAVTEHVKQLYQPGCAPEHRYELRAAIIKYLEQRLHEAQARERRLAQAITGADLPND